MTTARAKTYPTFATTIAGCVLMFGAQRGWSAVPVASPVPALPVASSALRVDGNDPLVLLAVDLLLPRERLQRQFMSNFEQGFAQTFDKDPQTIELERKFPGIRNAILEAARPVAKTALIQADGDLRAVYVRMLTDTFIRREFVQLDGFLQSPVGQKIVSLGEQVVGADKLLKAVQSSPDLSVTLESIARATNPVFLDSLTEDEIKAVTRFAITPCGRKFDALTPRIQAEIADWMSGLFKDKMGDIQAAVARAATNHIRNLKAAN